MGMPVGLQKQHSLWPAVAVAGQQAWLSMRLPLAWSLCVQGAQPHGLEEKVQPHQACYRDQCHQQQQVQWCRVLGGRKVGHSQRGPNLNGVEAAPGHRSP